MEQFLNINSIRETRRNLCWVFSLLYFNTHLTEKGVKNNGYFKLGKKGSGDCLQKRNG